MSAGIGRIEQSDQGFGEFDCRYEVGWNRTRLMTNRKHLSLISGTVPEGIPQARLVRITRVLIHHERQCCRLDQATDWEEGWLELSEVDSGAEDGDCIPIIAGCTDAKLVLDKTMCRSLLTFPIILDAVRTRCQ